MPKGPLDILSESMFYVLMALSKKSMCGTEIAEWVTRRTGGRVTLGPGTLYTILGKFKEHRMIQEVAVDGRKRTYRITNPGLNAYWAERDRLRACVRDADMTERRY